MIKSYTRYLKNYARFSGITNRSGYWWVALANLIIYGVFIALIIIFGSSTFLSIISGNIKQTTDTTSVWIIIGLFLLLIIYAIATIIPNFSLLFRRIKDTGLSGWWFLLIPLTSILSGLSKLDNLAWLSIFNILVKLCIFIITILPTRYFNKNN